MTSPSEQIGERRAKRLEATRRGCIAAREIADRYAIGTLRDDLAYEIEREINLAIATLTGVPPGPVDPPPPPHAE